MIPISSSDTNEFNLEFKNNLVTLLSFFLLNTY